MDPITWVAAGTALLKALDGPGGGGGVLQPSNLMSGAPVYLNQDIDFSGFTVGTGGAKVTGAPNNKTTAQGAGMLPPEVKASLGSMLPALIVGGAALLGVMWNR